MGYSNQVYRVPFNNSGVNASYNLANIPPESLSPVSRNINLHEGGLSKRGGCAHVDAAVMSGAPKVVGIFDYYPDSGTQFVVRATGDGKIYKDDTTTIKTGLGTDKVTSFAVMNDSLYITNANDVPQVWDGAGASTTALANVPTDWGSTGPAQFVLHGTGNSEQMWAFGVPTKERYVYASKNNDGATEADFSDAEVLAIYIETGDGYGIVGGFEFQDRLFAVGRKKTFLINDTNATRANWFYESAGWDGGAASHRLIVKTPNDVHLMTDDGEIYTVTAVQSYGDYKSASITRPSKFNNFIKDNVNLQYVTSFHATYDPDLRAVKWFVVSKYSTVVDMALVYFIDKDPENAWTVHDNTANASGYDAFCSAVVRQSAGGYYIYTGDYSGFVWKLEQTTKSDNSNGYPVIIQTQPLTFGDVRTTKRYDTGNLVIKPVNEATMTVTMIFDGGSDTGSATVSTVGQGGLLDSFLLDTNLVGGATIVQGNFDIGYVGKDIAFRFVSTTAAEDFFISELLIDFKPVGLRP